MLVRAHRVRGLPDRTRLSRSNERMVASTRHVIAPPWQHALMLLKAAIRRPSRRWRYRAIARSARPSSRARKSAPATSDPDRDERSRAHVHVSGPSTPWRAGWFVRQPKRKERSAGSRSGKNASRCSIELQPSGVSEHVLRSPPPCNVRRPSRSVTPAGSTASAVRIRKFRVRADMVRFSAGMSLQRRSLRPGRQH